MDKKINFSRQNQKIEKNKKINLVSKVFIFEKPAKYTLCESPRLHSSFSLSPPDLAFLRRLSSVAGDLFSLTVSLPPSLNSQNLLSFQMEKLSSFHVAVVFVYVSNPNFSF